MSGNEMISAGRCRQEKRWWRISGKPDEYVLMLLTRDWKLGKKTDALRTLIDDRYAFPPFQHITIFGPLILFPDHAPDEIFSAIESASGGLPGLPLRLNGYIRLTGRRGQAIAHEVMAGPELIAFHDGIWKALHEIGGSMSPIDDAQDIRRFHITHGYNLRQRDANRICEAIQDPGDGPDTPPGEGQDRSNPALPGSKVPANFQAILKPDYASLTVLRVAVLKNGILDREFDLPAREWLPRGLLYNPDRMAVSLMQYRKLAGIDLVSPPASRKHSFFITSDLHLGHENIIKYCRRPFSSAAEMDRVLMNNWNRTIGETDPVLFLGDLRYGTDAPPADEYIRHLNGQITFVRGNHDEGLPGVVSSIEREVNGEKCLFIHNPEDAPADFPGWVVHGHCHNNNLRDYPFINFRKKRVNVSTEMTGYRPVSIEQVQSIIRAHHGDDPVPLMPGGMRTQPYPIGRFIGLQ